MNKLIVVDMQNDFIYGSLGSTEASKIVKEMNTFIKEFRKNGEVIFTKDTHFDNYLETLEGKKLPVAHCIKETEGWEIIKELEIKSNDLIIEKETFGYLNWDKYISELDEITIIGVCSDICVVSNALIIKAIRPNNKITVISSLCSGTTIENHQKAMDIMKSCLIDVI